VSQQIRIPDIGDAESVEVVEILVAPGDRVGPDDPIIVIESDKASMEVPAGVAGVIESIDVAIGDQVVEGQVIATLAGAAESTTEAEATVAEAVEPKAAEREPEPSAARTAATQPAPAAPSRDETDRSMHEIRVPDIGEADHVVVIEIAVAAGADVQADDLLVVIESDKASMEIPVGVAGRIEAIHVKEGDEVSEGTLLATVAVQAAAAAPASAPAPGSATGSAPSTEADSSAATEAAPSPSRPAADRDLAPARAATAALKADAEAVASGTQRTVEQEEPPPAVYAGPAVRRLARELGVQLEQVRGSGLRGRVVKDDVKAFVKERMSVPAAAGAALPALPQIDFSRFGPVETLPMSRIRVRGAENLHRSWLNVPHVTQHDEVDVTDLEAFRRSLKAEAQARNVKLTPVAFLIKACCQALAEFPTVNASLDAEARNYILKRYYHIGIAVDTEDGLVVPVVRDADRKGIWQLAQEVAELSDKARARKLTPADHQGGTFSITSLGAIGGTGFTPIVNAPEVAILGVARLATRPQWNGREFVPREMLPLSLSYDHRAINGAEAARFVARLAELLGDIRRLIL